MDSASKKMDDEEKTRNLIKKAIELIGEENLLLDPDCGLKKVPIDMATKKLKLMIKLNKELSK